MKVFHHIEEAIEDIRRGKMVIVVDNEDRENEGDFICAAECITPEAINFMAREGRGLICAPIDEQRADELNLPLMVRTNTALHETAFTVSVDLIGHGCTTGISTHDRARTIRALADKKFVASDFARPGHIFPLRAKSGGVLQRSGHTEAAVDMARLAGLKPAGALVEILNEDGSMARLPQLIEKAKRYNMKIIAISDLIEYRLQRERLVHLHQRLSKTIGDNAIDIYEYVQITNQQTHVAFVKGQIQSGKVVTVRVQYCDAFAELLDILVKGKDSLIDKALRQVLSAECGVLLLLSNKERTPNPLMRIVEEPSTPVPRSEQDQRDIGIGAQILRDLNVQKMALLTNNPRKTIALQGYGLEIVSYLPLH